ncbi:SMP-30/gluconolactonase/LRE family protein [Metabacillus sp. RGM 3146]|uniref:SMP-30/gluconolactonase/LRE family protein n=1 Tax=Metabacillus sp. RGM 3146 TaxID=3401092 RepID=UPI003B9A277E
MKKPELVIHANAVLAEGPCWDHINKVLYWVDIKGKDLHVYDPEKNSDRTIHIGQFVGTVAPAGEKEVALAMENGFHLLNLDTEELTFLKDPEEHIKENRFNDGKCDAMGRFWAGTMDKDGEGNTGSLYCLDHNLKIRKIETNLGISNGLAWNKENTTFYFIDTPTQSVAAYDFDLEAGEVSNKRTVIHVPDEEGFPDGMTIDEEGMLWIAHYNGNQVGRWNPETGKMIESFPLPVSQVTCCTFGGKDLDELYITTGRENLDEEALVSQPLAGSVFKIKTETRGLKANFFKLGDQNEQSKKSDFQGADLK